MSDNKLLDILLEKAEKSGRTKDEVAATSKLGKLFRRQGVKDSHDLQRVLKLPRRQWQNGITGTPEEMAELLTQVYKRPGGKMTLRPAQAISLTELHDFGGLFALIKVGGGKTLISTLAAKVLEAKRPLLLIPAKLREKTHRDYRLLQIDWVLPQITIESYEMLSRVQGAEILSGLRPDLIIADEAHKLKHPKSAATRRVKRYMSENPTTKFVALSGTMTRNSLHEYWHIIRWCLGDHGMPLPNHWEELTEWADCLDATGNGTRNAPGALEQLCNDEERESLSLGMEASLTAVRRAYQRRLVETPGVISTGDSQVACSLTISEIRAELEHLAPYFDRLRNKWETPDGQTFSEPVDLWRHARELTCGCFYVWWNKKDFQAAIEKLPFAQFSSIEQRIFHIAKSMSGFDMSMVKAVEIRQSDEPEPDFGPSPASVDAAIEVIQQDVSEVSCHAFGKERLAAWVMLLKKFPNLLPMLIPSIKAARPPQSWLFPRSVWNKFVRMTLNHSRKWDTELQVVQAVTKCTHCSRWLDEHQKYFAENPDSGLMPAKGVHPACHKFRAELKQEFTDEETGETFPNVWDNWVRVRDTFKPIVEAAWIDDTTLKLAAEWLKEHNGIAWVEHRAVGEKLAEMTGLVYYGEGGRGKKFVREGHRVVSTEVGIIEATIDDPRSCIASIQANSEGRNLQHYSESLVISCPPNGAILEQLIGRFHRDGQMADEVKIDLLLSCKEQLFGFYRAVKDAKYIQDTTGNSQKLIYADVTVTTEEEAQKLMGHLWGSGSPGARKLPVGRAGIRA